MTENEAIKICNTMIFAASLSNPQGTPLNMTKEELTEAMGMAINALEEVQQYRQIGTVEECRKNKDFLDFLSDKMNPNDFEIYLRLYNALEEKGCEE